MGRLLVVAMTTEEEASSDFSACLLVVKLNGEESVPPTLKNEVPTIVPLVWKPLDASSSVDINLFGQMGVSRSYCLKHVRWPRETAWLVQCSLCEHEALSSRTGAYRISQAGTLTGAYKSYVREVGIGGSLPNWQAQGW